MSSERSLYPIQLEPMFQYRRWGGRRFETLLGATLPGEGPIGEAWVLSDRPEYSSKIANGPLAGHTLTELMADRKQELLGEKAGKYERFPLLLKFLDAKEVLSVQVHPSDDQIDLLPEGENGKTEAWFVLEAAPDAIVYGGLAPGITQTSFKNALEAGTVQDTLAHFKPDAGDTIFIPARTVHTMGGVVVFEVQENSDMTFRLYDWGKVDPQTGRPRELHVEQGLATITFPQDPITPVKPAPDSVSPVLKESLVQCDHFNLWRVAGDERFSLGATQECRIGVCLEGEGDLVYADSTFPVKKGDVWLLPAIVGQCEFKPRTKVEFLELAIPE
jgi:mannose-6-phosphate isomerase